MARPGFDEVGVGDQLPARSYPITRLDLVRYCGASGDFNVIHWNQRIAQSVGLPDVIAHGMLTMATAARLVTEWAGDPGAVVEYGVRFTKPVVVPDDDRGALLEVSGVVSAKDEQARTVSTWGVATSRSPATIGRWCVNRCSPCTTRE